MITVRSISGDTFLDGPDRGLGAPRYLVVPDGATPVPSHEIGVRAWLKQLMATFPHGDVVPAGAAAMTGDLVVFVHGFNEGIDDVIAQHRLIADGMAANGFACTLVSFDWPSWTQTYAYLEELDTAQHTAIKLVNAGVRPMLSAQTPDCQVAIHAVCHSMGAYVAREAFDHADKGTVTGSDWALGQLVLMAGDVEQSDFVAGNPETESMLGHTYRLTNYFNKNDAVLQISNLKRIGVEPRVGRVGLPPDASPKTVNIDCSAHFETVQLNSGNPLTDAAWSHSWYFKDAVFLKDLAATLRGSVDRTVVPGRVAQADGSLKLLG